MANKRQRTDTIKGELNAIEAVLAGPLEPPKHCKLRETDWPFWYSIIESRARDKWDACDLEVAANLARCKADIERLQTELQLEGDVIKNDRGTPIVNPKHSLLETLSRRCLALARHLQVHPEAKQGPSRDQGKALDKQRQMQKTVEGIQDDELLGGMRH